MGTDGKRSEETRFLEIAHYEPYAWGGANTAENLTLRCRPHNLNDPATREKSAAFITDTAGPPG